VQHLDDAWNSHVAGHNAFCDFGGNGDGSLFYPGKPSIIGGTNYSGTVTFNSAGLQSVADRADFIQNTEGTGAGWAS